MDMFCSGKKMGTLTQNITTLESGFPVLWTSMQTVVVVCTAGFGADPERRGCRGHDAVLV